MSQRIDPSLPQLRDFLDVVNAGKLARAIGRDRSFIQRLRNGQPLQDPTLIEPLARALRRPVDQIRAIVENDVARARVERRQRRKERAA